MKNVVAATGAPTQAKSHQRNAILLAGFVSLAWIAGCAGLVSSSPKSNTTPTPSSQTYSLSGTISPSAGGNGATVALSGATTASVTAGSSGAYTFTGLAAGTYAVTPSLTGYTFSPVSQSVTVSTANVTGINFTAAVQGGGPHSATASWTAPTVPSGGAAIAGYNLYRGTVSGGPYTKLNSSLITVLTYSDGTVQASQTYYYVATTLDTSGNESVFSSQVTATIP